jgi:hypothetical protein
VECRVEESRGKARSTVDVMVGVTVDRTVEESHGFLHRSRTQAPHGHSRRSRSDTLRRIVLTWPLWRRTTGFYRAGTARSWRRASRMT